MRTGFQDSWILVFRFAKEETQSYSRVFVSNCTFIPVIEIVKVVVQVVKITST